MAKIFVELLEAWGVVGLVVAVAFVVFGVGRIDAGARGGSWGLRLLLVPASAAFWPWIVHRWWRRPDPPVECTYHRCAVETPQED